MFIRLIIRDLSRALASGGMAMPIVFFLLVATLYPFAVGPDAQLLARSGGGMLCMISGIYLLTAKKINITVPVIKD